jgi:hypothetical protein
VAARSLLIRTVDVCYKIRYQVGQIGREDGYTLGKGILAPIASSGVILCRSVFLFYFADIKNMWSLIRSSE